MSVKNIIIAVNAFIIYNIMLCGFGPGVKAANLGEACDPKPTYRYGTLILNTIHRLLAHFY
jgi:hypothetical protein